MFLLDNFKKLLYNVIGRLREMKIKKENNCPRNCDECPRTHCCNSAYGWDGCYYKEQIKK